MTTEWAGRAQPNQACGTAWVDVRGLGADVLEGRVWSARGGLPPDAQAALTDLDGQALWWTSLSWSDVWRVGRWRHWWAEDAWGVPRATLRREAGLLDDEPDAWSQEVSAWSEMITRLTLILQSMGSPSGQAVLSRDVVAAHRAMTPDDDIPMRLWSDEPGVRLTQPVPRRPEQHPTWWRLSMSRRIWWRSIAESVRPPVGPWQEVDPSWLPRLVDRETLATWPAPILVRVMPIVDTPLAQQWWGERGQSFPHARRDPVWVTGEEAVDWLDAGGQLTIDAAYAASDWAPPVPWATLAPWDEGGPLADASLTWGLMAHAVGLAHLHTARDPSPSSRAVRLPPACAWWWRAEDRRRLRPVVARLVAAGLRVGGYGQGQVDVMPPTPAEVTTWQAAMTGSGLLLPPGWGAPANSVDIIRHHHGLSGQVMLDRLVATWPADIESTRAVLRETVQWLRANNTDPEWDGMLRTQTQITVDRLQARQDRDIQAAAVR